MSKIRGKSNCFHTVSIRITLQTSLLAGILFNLSRVLRFVSPSFLMGFPMKHFVCKFVFVLV